MIKLSCQQFSDYVVNWYHTYLVHQGMERIEASISQHYYWPNLRDYIPSHIKVLNNFHKNRKRNLKYVKLADKEEESIP